jgi:hypothetical protein
MIMVLLSGSLTLLAVQQPAAQVRHEVVRVFLDCNRCDEDYLKKEVTFIDYVRNREDADVHVLVTTQQNGGGGLEFTLKFIGAKRFQGQDQTLTYNSPQTATDDERRAGFAEEFRLGLVRYAADSPVDDRLLLSFKKPEGTAAPGGQLHVPWIYWVYRIGPSGDANGAQSTHGQSYRRTLAAIRTTDAWRLSFHASARYSDSSFAIENDDGTPGTIVSVNRNTDVSSTIVKSLTQHWSLGLLGQAGSETFRNYALRARVAPGFEYDFYPYSESTRRMLTFQYTVGYDYHRYREVTIYDKMREQLLDHRAEVGISLRQPWGSVSADTTFSQYLTDPSKYSLGMFGGANIRVFKGFSVSVFSEFSRTRDQIYLPRGEASTEEILLRQRQLATGYQYFVNFGISYSFGSIFNNIVNPRFGGVNFDF